MRRRTTRRLRRLGLVAVAVPLGAWALERAARQAETRGGRAGQLGGRLRQGAELLGRHGRGPLASRLRPPTQPQPAEPTAPATPGGQGG